MFSGGSCNDWIIDSILLQRLHRESADKQNRDADWSTLQYAFACSGELNGTR